MTTKPKNVRERWKFKKLFIIVVFFAL